MYNQKKRSQKGFTLVELVVVVVIVGILGAVLVGAIRGSTDGAKATAMTTASEKISNVLNVVAQACGVSSAVTGNALPAATKTLSDVIFGGSANVAAAYQPCYNSSSAKALTEQSQVVGAGVYSVQGFNVSLAGGGSAPLQVSFAAVPDAIALLVAQRYNNTLTTLAASDTTGAAVQYSTATGGTRTVTIIKQ